MQQGSIIKAERKHGPAVGQFRWSETGPQGQRVYRKRVVGTIEDYSDSEAVREAFRSLIAKPSSGVLHVRPTTMTVGDLCHVSAGAKIDIIPVEKCATPGRSAAGPILDSEEGRKCSGGPTWMRLLN